MKSLCSVSLKKSNTKHHCVSMIYLPQGFCSLQQVKESRRLQRWSTMQQEISQHTLKSSRYTEPTPTWICHHSSPSNKSIFTIHDLMNVIYEYLLLWKVSFPSPWIQMELEVMDETDTEWLMMAEMSGDMRGWRVNTDIMNERMNCFICWWDHHTVMEILRLSCVPMCVCVTTWSTQSMLGE